MDGRQRTNEDDFPFITNKKTVKYIHHSKVMFIMRGLPGSGKSTLASQIVAKYPNAVICSADDFFMTRGRYRYDSRQIRVAHERCQSKAADGCHSGANVVIIDNTNLRFCQMKIYVDLAAKYNYTILVINPSTWWSRDAAELSKRNIHGLTRWEIEDKLRSYEDILPLYWGWFLNENDSDMLMEMGKKYFSACMRKIPKFCQQMKKRYCGANECQRADHSLYRLYKGSNQLTPDGLSYRSQQVVQKAMGRVYVLHVIGIAITPNTVGARVALNQHQMLLWGRNGDDCQELPHQNRDGRNVHPDNSLRNVTARLRTMSLTDGPYEELCKRPRFSPVSGPGSQAHLTLGWAAHCQAMQTGSDHLEVINLEARSLSNPKVIQLDGAVGRYYGDGQCVIYFDKPLDVKALFSGMYG